MVADLVAKEPVGRCPRQHLLVGVARGDVAGDGEVVAMDNRGGVDGQRGMEQSISMKHLKKNPHYHNSISTEKNNVALYYLSTCLCLCVHRCAQIHSTLPTHSYVCVCYLSRGPGGALADIRNTEAETVCAAEWMILLQVVETRLTQITVSSHHVHLRKREQVRPRKTGEISERGSALKSDQELCG